MMLLHVPRSVSTVILISFNSFFSFNINQSYHSFYFPCGRAVSSWRIIHKRLSMSTSLVTFALLPVTTAAVVGISHSEAMSVALLVELTALTIWQQQLAKIFTVTVTLKDTAITFTREECEWGSGLETAIMAMHLLTHTQAGPQCPGSSLKKWREHNSKLVWPHVPKDAPDSKIVLVRDFKSTLNSWTPHCLENKSWEVKICGINLPIKQ